jgi:hypothetical protein
MPIEIMDDSEYYYARLQTVADGHPFIGNPYFKEHANDPAVAFFGADWIASIPLITGIPLFPSIFIDLLVGVAAYVLLSLWIAKELGFETKRSVLIVVASLFVASFWLLERPVAMQVVFPAYLAFIGAYLSWLNKPASLKRGILLAVVSALTFYLYTYLWQISVVALILSCGLLVLPNRRQYFSILPITLGTAVLAAPMIWYTYKQLHAPYYWETVARIGFVATHTFGSAALVNLALVLAGFAALACARLKRAPHAITIFFSVTAVALIGTTFSNVITGKDLETAVHFQRFVYVWAAIAAAYALNTAYKLRREEQDKGKLLNSAGILVSGIILLFLLGSFIIDIRSVTTANIGVESYAAPLAWLAKNAPAHSVVLADDSFSYYVPVITHDYVLFQPDGGLYLMSDREVEDRYLASNIYSNLTLTDIKNDFRLYGGVGNAVHQYLIHNRDVDLCRIFIRSKCGTIYPTAVAYRGEPYFDSLLARYEIMKENPTATLHQYGVSYVVVDSRTDTWNVTGLKADAAFGPITIYSFP